MFVSNVALVAITALASLASASLEKRASPLHSRATLPDSIDVKVKNLYPEDGVYDVTRQILYQSNLWKGLISTWKPSDSSHFNVKIDGVSSSGSGTQQMAGLSLDRRINATKLYAVAKPSDAFRFDAVHDQGPCSFHSFDLPLSATSKPIWSVNLKPVQATFESKYGTRPYGNVASAQDSLGNSYVIFALGAPAIAKVTPDGTTVSAWFWEASNGSQRPGYTGITYDEASDSLIAFGGPRALTVFRLSDATPTARTVTFNDGQNFGTLNGTEKIKNFPALVSAGGGARLFGAKAPYIYSFQSSDSWSSVTFKRFTRSQFDPNSLTSMFEYSAGGNTMGVYGTSAYFADGAHGGRTDFIGYKVDKSLLQ
ncbi:hypothetical protein CBS101457_006786 [Exobasidium rhododendri]|nr:hypothetical protein CBS101457_006786 [Exobasidium rhododendri]